MILFEKNFQRVPWMKHKVLINPSLLRIMLLDTRNQAGRVDGDGYVHPARGTRPVKYCRRTGWGAEDIAGKAVEVYAQSTKLRVDTAGKPYGR